MPELGTALHSFTKHPAISAKPQESIAETFSLQGKKKKKRNTPSEDERMLSVSLQTEARGHHPSCEARAGEQRDQ
jgi:hypothetical protein